MSTIVYAANKKYIFYIQLFGGVLVLMFFLSSCGTTKSPTYYFKNLQKDTTIKSAVSESFEMYVKKNDVITINISALSDEEKLFNKTQVYSSYSKLGYLVDSNGNIQLLKLGNVHVEGLTLRQISTKLEKELTPYLKEPIVVATFATKKILVFGEVNAPQIIQLDGTKEKIPVLEAITMAGGISNSGNAKNVVVIREDSGQKVFKHLNFEDLSIFTSPWYNLKPDDIVYVQPDSKRIQLSDRASKRQQVLSLTLTGISLFFIIYDRFIRN